jgi:hypothetical protein
LLEFAFASGNVGLAAPQLGLADWQFGMLSGRLLMLACHSTARPRKHGTQRAAAQTRRWVAGSARMLDR